MSDPQLDTALLDGPCRQFATQVTGAQVTAGGRLGVGVVALLDNGQGGWLKNPVSGGGPVGPIACALTVVGSARLDATRTGIADSELPWA